MGRTVDTDDLIDAAGVAAILGLSHRNSVRVYRRRYDNFPEPVVDLGAGRCLLWLRSEVESWARSTGRSPQSH
jgi:predicted DNA-binding transcriptional regulator AlpA